MAEYIDREALLNSKYWAVLKNGFDAVRAKIIIDSIPSADVVEVVRCSECKHRHNPMRCALWYGTLDDDEYFLEHGNDFYCAFGERRSNNG